MIEILSFQIDLCAAQILCHLFGVVQAAWPAGIFVEQGGEFMVELRIVFVMIVGFFEFNDGVHQCFRDILAAVDSEASL